MKSDDDTNYYTRRQSMPVYRPNLLQTQQQRLQHGQCGHLQPNARQPCCVQNEHWHRPVCMPLHPIMGDNGEGVNTPIDGTPKSPEGAYTQQKLANSPHQAVLYKTLVLWCILCRGSDLEQPVDVRLCHSVMTSRYYIWKLNFFSLTRKEVSPVRSRITSCKHAPLQLRRYINIS